MPIIDSLRKSIEHEISICTHLHSKIDAKDADWRPRENMRSVTELLQYLCYIGTALTEHFVEPNPDADVARTQYRTHSKASTETVTFQNFPQMIEQEKKQIMAALANVTDADLERETYHMFSGEKMTLFEALTNSTLKYFTAYRMQLFLYAKMLGAELSTPNAWYGRDPKPRA